MKLQRTPLFMIFCFQSGRYHTARGWNASPDFAHLLTREEADEFVAKSTAFLTTINYDPRSAHADVRVLGHKSSGNSKDCDVRTLAIEAKRVIADARAFDLCQKPRAFTSKFERALTRFDVALDAFRNRLQAHEQQQRATR